MSKYRNVVIPLVVDNGSSSGKTTITTEPGFIKRAVIVPGAKNNTGMVRALIKDSTGNKVAELQAIEIYRSREVEYKDDGVPLNIKGGGLLTYEVIASANFTADFQSDLILVYEEEQENC